MISGRNGSMLSISLDNIENLSDSEITYLLYQEGKSIKSIAKIRKMDRSEIEKHIVECRIKYRIYEGTGSIEDVIARLKKCTREERTAVISKITDKDIKQIEKYCINTLFNCSKEDCSFYIWLLGEIKSTDAVPSISTFLKSADGNIKRACCSALGKIGDIKAEDMLIMASEDERPQVREYAVKAIGKIKSLKAVEMLNRMLNANEEKEYVKRAAEASLKLIIGTGDNNA